VLLLLLKTLYSGRLIKVPVTVTNLPGQDERGELVAVLVPFQVEPMWVRREDLYEVESVSP
jgi:hypothetical protein